MDKSYLINELGDFGYAPKSNADHSVFELIFERHGVNGCIIAELIEKEGKWLCKLKFEYRDLIIAKKFIIFNSTIQRATLELWHGKLIEIIKLVYENRCRRTCDG